MRARPVVVVTGGGGGIGAAVAEALGRTGWFVVTVDPLVSLDGAERLPAPEETTAGRIVAAGGQARTSSVSVTDGAAVRRLFGGLADEFGRLDAVVNVAGISRPTSFAGGRDEDWLEVLSVHLDGYRNVLESALAIMAPAGTGRFVGVTAGSGGRQADAGAYGCAKRAVAALTWELGRQAPAGVTVNAMSPIAVTRMVTAALAGRRRGPTPATGGLTLAAMPTPEELGPLTAHLVGHSFGWCSGEVLFVGGSEVAVIDRPRLLEVVRTDQVAAPAHLLRAATTVAMAPAEARQASTGGSNPRFAPALGNGAGGDLPASSAHTVAVLSDRPAVAAAVTAALGARGVRSRTVGVGDVAAGFQGATDALAAAVEGVGPLDAVVVALAGPPPLAGSASGWEQILAEHAGIVGQLHADAGWARAVADYAVGNDRPVRLVSVTDAVTAGGRSRAQASAQSARAALGATGDRVAAFAISAEGSELGDLQPLGDLVAHLVCDPEAPALSGAELVAGNGWFGLRSHPRPSGSIAFGGPGIPDWFDATLRDMARVGARSPATDREPTVPVASA